MVTQHGAWRFAPATLRTYEVRMGYIHDGGHRQIALFQESTTLEQKLGERLINRYPNRKIVNLMHMLNTGAADTIFVYGVSLQYDLNEGDPFIITLTSRRDPEITHEYYFRYHQTGVRADLDIAFLFPIDHFLPNPGDRVQGAPGGMAFSFSMARNMDPERRYGLFGKLLRAVRLNLIGGVTSLSVIEAIGGDQVIRSNVDGFAGVGITFFDFVVAGYGTTIFREPRTTFPVVGLEFRHAFDFLRSLKKDTHSRWEEYLREEQRRTAGATQPTVTK